jgi:hypothetical protein
MPRALLLLLAVLSLACHRPAEEKQAAAKPAAPSQPAASEEIVSPSGPGAAEPFLYAARDGSLLLSWIENNAVRLSRFRDGKWSTPSTVVARPDLFVNWADFPAVAEFPDGTLLVHWLQKSGKETYAYDVRFARSGDGGTTWSEPALLHDDGTKSEHGFVSFVADRTKPLVHAAWLDGRKMPGGGDMTLRAAAIDATGKLSEPAELDGRTCECCTTALAATDDGLVAAYRDRTAEEIRDISIVRKSGSAWTEPAVLHADGWKIAGCPVNGPQLDARGRDVVVAWYTTGRVSVAFSKDGGATFGQPIRVDAGAPTGRVDVLLLPGGDAFVTWIDGAGADTAIVARRVSPAGEPGPVMTIAKATSARTSGFPRAAQTGGGTYVAWTDVTPEKRIRIAKVAL